MVVTRSQTNKNKFSEQKIMSDNESDSSFPDLLAREQMIELDSDELSNQQRYSERDMIDQRFYEMNRQIGELTNIDLALTQQIPSNPREGDGLNMVTTHANGRSDMVTGVQNPQPSGSRTTPSTGLPGVMSAPHN